MKFLSGHNRTEKPKRAALRFAMIATLSFIGVVASACGISIERQYDLEDAIEAGIISRHIHDIEDSTPADFIVISPIVQEFTSGRSFTATPVFPNGLGLFFDNDEDDGEVAILVEENQLVSKGDVLAQLIYNVDARHNIDYEAAKAYLERLEQESEKERTRWQADIRKARRELASASGSARRQLSLNIRLLEIGQERSELISKTAQERQLKEISTLAESIGVDEIIAPFDGMVIDITKSKEPSTETRILSVVDPSVFFFQITISTATLPGNLYSTIGHRDVFSLRGFMGHINEDDDGLHPDLEFEVRVVTEPWATGQRSLTTFLLAPVDPDGLLTALQALDDGSPSITLRDMSFFAPLEFVVTPRSLTLPVEAIHRHRDREFVLVHINGSVERRYVSTGDRLDDYVQIVAGIEEDTKVVMSP